MALERKSFQLDRLVFVLVVIALVGLWSVVLLFTNQERELTLERAREQLALSLYTLADYNELSNRLGELSEEGTESRNDAFWQAMLQYPAASIWVESEDGTITSGLPADDLNATILVEEQRSGFSVFAALPEEEALSSWYQTRRERIAILLVATAAFLIFTQFLVRALRQRTNAERNAAREQERNRQLEQYREQLEQTVNERTGELADANTRLADELKERKTAEKTLREHDALLSSVTKGASELLGTHNNEEAVQAVLELVGNTIAVSRVQLLVLDQKQVGHIIANLTYEWCAPGLSSLVKNPRFQHIDINNELPKEVSRIFTQGMAVFHLEDIREPYRIRYKQAGMQSFLMIPILMENKPWGVISFIDSAKGNRQWSWAETDTLRTLAGLVGVAMNRARYTKELADANTIVQNSPTILYRLKGEPSFPLIYISHNITKFGHDAVTLLQHQNWIEKLVEEEDRDTVLEAMGRMLDSTAQGASIEFRLLTGSGSHRWVENRYTPIRDDRDRLIEVEGIIIDITERKAAEEKIAAMARSDALTGLANRTTFNERLNQLFSAASRGATPFAVFYMDLDRFKTINDTLGHALGDKLLIETARRLRRCVRSSDLVARLGGDEFAILQSNIKEVTNAGKLAVKLQEAINRPLVLDGNELHMTCSIGICPWSANIQDADSLLTQADLALYRAKEDGRNCYRFHSAELDREVLQHSRMADELRIGVEQGQLELAWQPQVAIDGNAIVGIEALVRWNHPTRGLLDAHEFVPVAEKSGIIMVMGQWVLNEACRQLRQWRDEGVTLKEITINLSGVQLKNSRDLITDVVSITKKWGLSPEDIEFDVTEAMLAQTTWTQNDVLNQLNKLGCKIAIDRFGAEYSSIDYLRAYSISHLKITSTLIRDAIENPDSANTIKAIIQLARDLKVGVIVEGVETKAQNKLLQGLNQAANAQGYFYSKAVTGGTAGEMLQLGHLEHEEDESGEPNVEEQDT